VRRPRAGDRVRKDRRPSGEALWTANRQPGRRHRHFGRGTPSDISVSGRLVLDAPGSRAEIDPFGAELTSWRVAGRELMWQADPAHWARSAPILFPMVGHAAGGEVRFAGQVHPMPVHGFASSLPFTVERTGAGEATLSLLADERTRRHYPFAFRLAVSFALGDGTLSVTLRVRNDDERNLPYAAGLHPGFAWPSRSRAGNRGAILFSAEEDRSVPVITAQGLFSADRRRLALDGRTMALTADNLGQEAVCFLHARSNALTFMPGDGSALDIAHDGFPHVAIWTRNGAPFLSVESWTGYGDAPGYAGEFADRPSMTILPPGATAAHAAHYSFREPSP
jgi:galactose mutarotase-like enzyme